MRIIMCDSSQEAVKTVSDMVLDKLESHPASVLGLATGKTMEPVYRSMVEDSKSRNLNFGKTFFFMLDEYMGLPAGHPASFQVYIQNHLMTQLDLDPGQFSFPPVHAPDPDAGAEHYEQSIKESGGIDLQLLGIGTNGHIGFNEPGSPKDSRARVVKLTPETIEANKDNFKDEKSPDTALSMGISTILESKTLVMLATGKSKADAIKFLVNHHDVPDCPATYLKGHPQFILVLDPEAASKINLKI
ncbi:MAG TPA: glucosamine-6-phosphate deaminase [Bacteriovoracaceae bacterium]|nr:glucosamine-6-phosphate deaminase [Bacteriovoracaceae bacterium]